MRFANIDMGTMDMKKDGHLIEIEELENKYLNKYWHFLKFSEEEIIKGFNTKKDILNDWKGKYGKGKTGSSNFAVGAERIVYAILNGKIAGQPNSSPVSSDLFFETDDAYIHIDLKTVTTKGGTKGASNDNIGDFNTSISIGLNQNSYKYSRMVVKSTTPKKYRKYVPNLPTYYTKTDGTKKICLSFFITILSNEITMDTEMITIMSFPNGELSKHYKSRPLKPGKNKGETRYNFIKTQEFELLDDKPKRIKIVYINPSMSVWIQNKLSFLIGLK